MNTGLLINTHEILYGDISKLQFCSCHYKIQMAVVEIRAPTTVSVAACVCTCFEFTMVTYMEVEGNVFSAVGNKTISEMDF